MRRPSQITRVAALTAVAVVLAASGEALAQGEGSSADNSSPEAGETKPEDAARAKGDTAGDDTADADASASEGAHDESASADASESDGEDADPGESEGSDADASQSESAGAEAADAGTETEAANAGTEVGAEAEEEEIGPPPPLPPNALPGSPRPPGLSLSPEAPPGPPAPGGRAPSFGSPMPDDDWTFGITGRISGYEMVGLGRHSSTAPPNTKGQVLHVPPETPETPYWAGAAFGLNFKYGNPRVTANVSFNANLNSEERRGYHMSETGPDIMTAYLAYSPEPIGRLQLRFKVGAFRENYGGPGEWGWGVNGPLIGIKGYGESVSGEMPLTPNLQLLVGHGLTATPAVPESFVRGQALGWVETGRSTWVHHWHLGLSYRNQYIVKVHAASAQGTDERQSLTQWEPAADGHMNAYVLELRSQFDPFGQLGISTAFWDFAHGNAVHDGIFWGIGWTAGGREMVNNYLGPSSHGNGKLGAVSAEYSFSVARILWHPRTFDGRAPDIRVKLGAIVYSTFQSDDDNYDQTFGYELNPQAEYLMLRWFAVNVRLSADNRPYTTGRYSVNHLTTALVFRKDWQSLDRIELAYSRMFYSDQVDSNPAAPLDRHIVTLGAVMSF